MLLMFWDHIINCDFICVTNVSIRIYMGTWWNTWWSRSLILNRKYNIYFMFLERIRQNKKKLDSLPTQLYFFFKKTWIMKENKILRQQLNISFRRHFLLFFSLKN